MVRPEHVMNAICTGTIDQQELNLGREWKLNEVFIVKASFKGNKRFSTQKGEK